MNKKLTLDQLLDSYKKLSDNFSPIGIMQTKLLSVDQWVDLLNNPNYQKLFNDSKEFYIATSILGSYKPDNCSYFKYIPDHNIVFTYTKDPDIEYSGDHVNFYLDNKQNTSCGDISIVICEKFSFTKSTLKKIIEYLLLEGYSFSCYPNLYQIDVNLNVSIDRRKVISSMINYLTKNKN